MIQLICQNANFIFTILRNRVGQIPCGHQQNFLLQSQYFAHLPVHEEQDDSKKDQDNMQKLWTKSIPVSGLFSILDTG